MTQKKSLADRIVSASIVVGIAHLCLKFVGLIQTKAAAQYLENYEYEAIFSVAAGSIIFNLFSIGEEVIGPTLLPVFVREREEYGDEAAWSAVNVLLTLQTIILLVVTAGIMCAPDFFIGILTEWTPESRPEHYRLLRESLVWLAPSLIFLSLGSTTYILLNSHKKFFLAAFGDSSWKICVVLSLAVGMGLFKFDHRALYFGILIGSAAKLGTHLIGLWRKFGFVHLSFNLQNRGFRAILVLMLPLIGGILVAKTRDIVNNTTVMSALQQGVLQANHMGRKLHEGINWIVPFTIQVAIFPFLCDLVEQNDFKRVGQVLTNSCRLLLACFIPGAICLAMLGEWFSVLLFVGGKTGLQVALWAGLATTCYLTVLPGAAVECVLMQGFFANRRMMSVTIIGVTCSILSAGISAFCILHLKVQPVMGLIAVALGFSFSRTLKSILLIIYLKRSIPLLPFKETSLFLIRVAIVGIVVGGVTWGAKLGMSRVLDDGLAKARTKLVQSHAVGKKIVLKNAKNVKINRKRLAIKIIVTGSLGALSFLVASFIVRLKEPFDMIKWTLDKVQKKTE